MADILITGVDEQIKNSFEQFCDGLNLSAAAAFNALVKVGASIREQGLLRRPNDEIHTNEAAAIKQFFAEIDGLKDEENILTDDDWAEFANLRSQSSPQVKKAVVTFRELSAEERVRDTYERQEMARRDMASREKWAAKKRDFEIAKKLLKRSRPLDEIIEDTGLSLDELENLRNEL